MPTSPSTRTLPHVQRYISMRMKLVSLQDPLLLLRNEPPCTCWPRLFDGTRYSFPPTRGDSPAGLGWFREGMVCVVSIHCISAHRSIPDPVLSTTVPVPVLVRSLPVRDVGYFWSDRLGWSRFSCTDGIDHRGIVDPIPSSLVRFGFNRSLPFGWKGIAISNHPRRVGRDPPHPPGE